MKTKPTHDPTPFDYLCKCRRDWCNAVIEANKANEVYAKALDAVDTARKALDLAKAELDKVTKELVK